MERPMPKGLVLQAGESVILDEKPTFAAAWPKYIFTLGLYVFWARKTYYMLTDQRVVVATGKLNKSVRSVPLEKVQDANLKSQLWVGFVVLSTAGGKFGIQKVGPMLTSRARLFMNAVHVQIDRDRARAAAMSPAPTGAESPTDQLKKLAELRDAGIVSREEFETKKAEILSRM